MTPIMVLERFAKPSGVGIRLRGSSPRSSARYMKRFTIDIEYCTSVNRHEKFDLYKTEEEKLIARLKYGTDKGSRTWSEDHPVFAKLRDQLGAEGFIEIQRSWWNGDRVLKPFQLNKKKFKKGDQFPSSAAIKWTLEH